MKIRSGFVSNSSTTSFCILGIELNSNGKTMKRIMTKIEEWFNTTNSKEIVNLRNQNNSFEQFIEDDYISDCFGSLEDENFSDLDFYQNENDTEYLGYDVDRMKDTETLFQFKRRILEELHRIGATNIKLEYLNWIVDEFPS